MMEWVVVACVSAQSLRGTDDTAGDDAPRHDDDSGSPGFVESYVFVIVIGLVLFCGCACLSANGVHLEQRLSQWRQPEDETDERRFVLLRDSLVESGEVVWVCFVCAFENKPRVQCCALCGASSELTRLYDDRVRETPSGVSLGPALMSANVRAQSFTIGRLNNLTLRQKGAARRHVWRRKSGAWVREPTARDSEAYVARLEEENIRWSVVEEEKYQLLDDGDDDDLEAVAARPFKEKQVWFARSVACKERPITFEVRRSHVLADSVKRFEQCSLSRLRRSSIRIRFKNESAVDAGGVQREWFEVVAKALFAQHFESRREAGYAANVDPAAKDLKLFRFAGRFVAKALKEQVSLPITLAVPLLKHVLTVPLSFSDLEFVDAESFQSYQWLRDNDPEPLNLSFEIESHELIPGGADIPVTQANKQEYLASVLKYRVLDAIKPQLLNFLRGFDDILDRRLLQVFDYQELQLLIAGLADFDLDDWRRHTRYLGAFAQLKDKHPTVAMFWRCLESFDNTERARLCQFVTGSSQLPPSGFKALLGDDGRYCHFALASLPRGLGVWPKAHTCFNRLDLPLYSNYDELQSYLRLSIHLEVVGFTIE